MNKEDYLRLIDEFEANKPKPSAEDLEWNRWAAELKDLLAFLAQSLGKVEEGVYSEFKRKRSELLSGTHEDKRRDMWASFGLNISNGLVMLRDWVERRFKYYQLTALNRPAEDRSYFEFKCLLTDFEAKKIWAKENKKMGQSFNEGALLQYWKMLAINFLQNQVKKEGEIENAIRLSGVEFHSLEKLHENLIQKLSTVSGLNRADVSKWFEKSNGNISLKN